MIRRDCAGLFLVVVALVACGNGSGNEGSEPAPSSGGSGIAPCELLTAAQVATVLPNSDEGFVAKAGGSLIEGVDSYQCSYSNPGIDGLTVIVTVASTDELFGKIEPNPSTSRQIYPDTFREVNVGDHGWIAGEPDDMELTAIAGRAVIKLGLMTSDAGEKGDALIELGSAVVAALP